jgi:hypothetical protein
MTCAESARFKVVEWTPAAGASPKALPSLHSESQIKGRRNVGQIGPANDLTQIRRSGRKPRHCFPKLDQLSINRALPQEEEHSVFNTVF